MSSKSNPQWTQMTPGDFNGESAAAVQQPLFVCDELDPCGTPVLEGLDGRILHPNTEK